MAGSDYDQSDSRIGDDQSPIGWEAICDDDVANWTLTDNFVFAFIITSTAHTPGTESFKVQWSKNAGVDWYDVGSASPNDDIGYGTSAQLVDGNPISDSCECQAGADIEDGEELEGDATTGNLSCSQNKFIEIQIACDPTNSVYSTEYIFRIYSVTASAGLSNPAASSLTIIADPTAVLATSLKMMGVGKM